jgi:hypothetical protein
MMHGQVLQRTGTILVITLHCVDFLIGNNAWNDAPSVWVENVPQQAQSLDCALFVIRHICCIFTGRRAYEFHAGRCVR